MSLSAGPLKVGDKVRPISGHLVGQVGVVIEARPLYSTTDMVFIGGSYTVKIREHIIRCPGWQLRLVDPPRTYTLEEILSS